ncbi:uncharacterized protein LOC108679706 [Hyalella azteca]|uniref:Uncharacterized protein LOC108679706 n=1 Tax=Hyalella azteca TaxID=294128 RepID=A0A8B7PCN6_HYAAZ|nr:uncharacterized protein LOC108679706 [Hyalella azteca]
MTSAGSIADDTIIRIYRNIVGNLDLSPRVMRFTLDKECDDKISDETYRELMERRRGRAYTNGEWKNLIGFSSKKLETSKNPDTLDVTPLFLLLTKLLDLRYEGTARDPAALLAKLRTVKYLRNTVMHDLHNAAGSQKFTELTAALVELVRETGRFYALPQADVDAEVQELNNEIAKLKIMDSQSIYYWCTRLEFSGKQAVRLLWQDKFKYEKLSLNEDAVQRQAVFHAIDVNVRETSGGKIVSYTKIFEARENVMVVTGVAGAGKTTLAKNIVLQFFNTQQTAPDYLRSFNQLIFFDCRDRTTTTLSDVILQHYEDQCIEHGKENVLMALLRLDVLFIIDGFDEGKESSKRVVNEIIEKTWRPNCRVLITTHSHAVKRELAPLLRRNDVSYAYYEILPLTKPEDQRAFLRRYEEALSGDSQTGAMTGSFESLSEDVRSLFTEPINLVHFCEMHKLFPKEISSWRTPRDVAPVKLRLYKELIQTQLAGSFNVDVEVLIYNILNVVGEAALEQLREDVLILTEADHFVIKEKIKKIKKVDPAVVLSVVLKENKPRGLNRSSSYEFRHKSEQEMFAGNYIVQRIISSRVGEESAEALNSILGVPKEGMSR